MLPQPCMLLCPASSHTSPTLTFATIALSFPTESLIVYGPPGGRPASFAANEPSAAAPAFLPDQPLSVFDPAATVTSTSPLASQVPVTVALAPFFKRCNTCPAISPCWTIISCPL